MADSPQLASCEILERYFPELGGFRDVQEDAVDRLANGDRILCLMPTGLGKSLIYQVAGLRSGKTTLVLSPLVALMDQQAERLQKRGIRAQPLHGALSGERYYRTVRTLFENEAPGFIFLSPERMFFDGYLEHVLRENRHRVGLVVIDEAHCISQWGHNFRPAYKAIPEFLRNVFGALDRLPLLCLTATLNPKDQEEIRRDFALQENCLIRSEFLLRDNLNLSFEILEDEEAKRERLGKLLTEHRGEKIIVYAHRIRSEYGTRALAERFTRLGFNCDFFDSQAGDEHRARVARDFEEGRLPIVFATNAFGMGIDISDIRTVIHYLVPESIEQYYQEVGRAGRDEKPSFGRLLFSKVNLKVRTSMIRSAFPSGTEIRRVYQDKFRPIGKDEIASINPWLDFSEEAKENVTFHALVEHRVLRIVTKGIQTVGCFRPVGAEQAEFRKYEESSRVGSVKIIARRTGIPIPKIVSNIYKWYDSGVVQMTSVPNKVLFYRSDKELTDKVLEEIVADMEEKKQSRLENFAKLVAMIESGQDPTAAIRNHLEMDVE
jgi:ATP-dependent DNA helicase RecQ